MDKKSNDNETVVLVSLETEIEASLLVDALKEEGIEAIATGGIASGFRAEAPGLVNVLVHQDDLEKAQNVAQEFSHEQFNIDWDNVDVDTDPTDDE